MARDRISDTDRKRGQLASCASPGCIPVRKPATGLADPFSNQGYATEAGCPVLDYGFRVMGLHRISAFSLTRNKATGRVMDTGGMRHEGVLRQHIQKTGNFEDVAVHGLLREEYLSGG